ncbi:MAG: alginate export family protein [Thermodesulfobacteriota bacterium]
MHKVSPRPFSLFTLVFSLIFFAAESNGQAPVGAGFDPDDPPETTIRLAPFLTFGAQIELEYTLERNLDLDGTEDEDLSTIEPGLTLAFSFDPSTHFQAFFDAKLGGEFLFEDGDKVDDKVVLEIEQAYLFFKDVFDKGFSFQIGRQRYEDERQWLYDEELDAAKVFYEVSDFSIELSVSRKDLADRDLLNTDEEERTNNYVVYGKYEHEEEEIERIAGAYVVFRDDKSSENNSPLLIGIHADGDLTEGIGSWLELAYAGGEDGSNKVRGFGFDLGSTYEFDLSLEPSITLGYAFGTGDGDLDDDVDKSFRQTGLQNNEGSFNGVPDFQYYGELLDPELSNLSIFTAGTGINLTEESSIDLVYHYYLQHKASDSLRDVGIDADPDGQSKRLGSEIDLILGYEGTNGLELALKLGYFIPGEAFPSDSENGFLTRLEIQYEF